MHRWIYDFGKSGALLGLLSANGGKSSASVFADRRLQMSAYIDGDEKLVARLGGTYSPGVEKAEQSLELTDRRVY